jgi:hypothetical protein
MTLDSGIPDFSDFSGDFSYQDFDDLINKVIEGRNAFVEVVVYYDNKTQLLHSLYLDPFAGFRWSRGEGTDFVAQTVSLATECQPITAACQLHNTTNANSTNHAVPFHCSPMFTGNLDVAPSDGQEQFKGWDSSFYQMSADGQRPENISIISALNPFQYNITAAISSESLATYIKNRRDTYLGDGDPIADVTTGTLVDVGHERIAFALSCTSTVYDVQYSMLSGAIDQNHFHATKADPRKAAIIKGPLQVGFGRHQLFQRAALAVLNSDYTIEEQMAIALSQIGMALAVGVFNYTDNVAQRQRINVIATKVPKAPLWLLLIVSATYLVVGTFYFIRALRLRTQTGETQLQLLTKVTIGWGTIKDMFGLFKSLSKSEKGWAKKAVGFGGN